MPANPKSADVGTGFFPNRDASFDITVFNAGGKSPWGIIVALAHVTTWVVAFVFGMMAGNTIDDISTVSSQAKALAKIPPWTYLGVVIIVVLHASLQSKDGPAAPFSGIFLMAVVVISAIVSSSVLTIASGASEDAYNQSLVSCILASLGAGMVLSFYVHFTHKGNFAGYSKGLFENAGGA